MPGFNLSNPISLCLFVGLFLASSCKRSQSPRIIFNTESATLNYGVDHFVSTISAGHNHQAYPSMVGRKPVIKILSGEDQIRESKTGYWNEVHEIPSDGFKIINERDTIYILASNDRGCLYGLQEICEQIEGRNDLWQITDRDVKPAFSFRAIKFNLPWSPYRPGKAAALHTETCRDLHFWEVFLDMMVENRFNALTLWNQHPFPYLIKSQNFPLANDFNTQEMDEWRSFWQSLFNMAKVRGIETYLVNWNIVVSKEFAEAYGAQQYDDRSELVKKYTRESVTQLINEYEDLTGLGVTLADWMGNWGENLMTSAQRESWIEETFVAGILDADRKIKFIHRAVLAGDPEEMRQVIDRANLPEKTIVEVKFNWSHGHSTPHLSLTHANHEGSILRGFWDPKPENYFIAWMIRNEDFFVLRWGDPTFIRDHIRTNHFDYVDGYFVGSEGYIPAKDYSYFEDHPNKTWNYAFEKQWLFYQLWGRLLYNPSESDKFFVKSFTHKYGAVDGGQMLKAFSLASRVPLYLASFYKSTWDFTLYSEGFLAPRTIGFDDHNSPFISLEELMKHDVLDRKYLSIQEFGDPEFKGLTVDNRTNPLQLADKIQMECHEALEIVGTLRSTKNSPTLNSELDDTETWCHLGFYFADKLRAGVMLQRFIHSKLPLDKTSAINHLEICVSHWKNIIQLTKDRYRPMPYVSIDEENPRWDDFTEFHWSHFLQEVERDIAFAKAFK